MVWGQSKVLRNALTRDLTLKIFLHIQTERLVGSNRLARSTLMRGFKQPETGVQQGFREEAGSEPSTWSAARTMRAERTLCVGTSYPPGTLVFIAVEGDCVSPLWRTRLMPICFAPNSIVRASTCEDQSGLFHA